MLRWIERFKIFFRLLANTLKTWSFGEWLTFWISSRRATVTLNGVTMHIRTASFTSKLSDVMIVFEVLHDGEYDMCAIYPDDTVIDIGGHIGSFSIMASRKAPNGTILTFEAFDETFRQLQKNLSENHADNVRAFNLAVSDAVGRQTLFVNRMNQAQNSLYADSGEERIVETTTLHNIFQENNIERCNLMKVDCEGAEYEILFSAREVLSKIDRIILEYHEPSPMQISKGYSPAALELLLIESGFTIKTLVNTHYRGVMYAERRQAA
jgi:FkbM family methyltransferase